MSVLDTLGRSLAEGWWMFYDTLWALVLGFALSGAVQAFVSKAAMQRSLGDHRPVTVAKASFFGMVSSSCSYAASALAKSLFARGADFTSSMAFMFASTNLVVELGAVLWLLIGWQFALAEFVGGVIMIGLLTLILPRVLPPAEVDQARTRLNDGENADDAAEENAGAPTGLTGAARLRSRAGWSDAAGYTISDVRMLRAELLIGFLVAGFAAIAVPVRWWQALFVTGHGWLSSLENVIIAPVLAFVSFVCSVGNVPLGAALWRGGISFGGVVAFIFADLLALPLVLIYRKLYGARLAVRLALVFWAVMSAAGLITEGLFRAVSLTPVHHVGSIASTHIGVNYTTVLDVLAVGVFAYLYWLYRNADRFGGGSGLAKDPVCGMQVRTADAPARLHHAGLTVYFCSDRCQDRFVTDPDTFTEPAAATLASATTQAATPEHPHRHGAADDAVHVRDPAPPIDPVCGMIVDPQDGSGPVDHDGRRFRFCSTGCQEAFAATPDRYTAARSGS